MMKAIFLVGAVAMLSGSCRSDDRYDVRQAGQQMRIGARELFRISLPPDCQISSVRAGVDFEVFEITCGTRYFGGLYAGNHADRDIPRSRLLQVPLDWPSEIQVWSATLPEPDQTRADQIVASVELDSDAIDASRRR